MKLSTLLLLILLAACGYYYWEYVRDQGEPQVSAEDSGIDLVDELPLEPDPEPQDIPQPEPPLEPVPIETVEDAPKDEPEVVDEVVDMRTLIRDTLEKQRSVEVPHSLDNAITITGVKYSDAMVFRVEPDGINIRHAEGIVKIPLEEMQPEWRDRYHMDSRVASEYRIRQREREREAWSTARERERLAEERRRQTLHEGHLAAEERRQEWQKQREAAEVQRRRDAWAIYDRDLAEWRRRNARYSPTRGWVEINRPGMVTRSRPSPPPFPRPR